MRDYVYLRIIVAWEELWLSVKYSQVKSKSFMELDQEGTFEH